MGPWSGDGSALACEYALVADRGERDGERDEERRGNSDCECW